MVNFWPVTRYKVWNISENRPLHCYSTRIFNRVIIHSKIHASWHLCSVEPHNLLLSYFNLTVIILLMHIVKAFFRIAPFFLSCATKLIAWRRPPFSSSAASLFTICSNQKHKFWQWMLRWSVRREEGEGGAAACNGSDRDTTRVANSENASILSKAQTRCEAVNYVRNKDRLIRP